jgi:pilus assembly protein CpaC
LVTCAAAALKAQTATPLSQPSGPSIQDSSNELTVAVGKSVLIDCAKPLARIVVGLGEYAEAQAISPTELMISGKAPGETSLIIWDTSGGRQFFNVTVRAPNLITTERIESLRRELRTELPGQSVKVTTENGNVFLRGTVKDLESSERAVQIAATAGKVVNLLYVDVPPADRQILLKVRFASIDLTKLKQFGINFYSTGFGNVAGGVSTGQFSPPTVTSGATGSSATISNDLNLSAFLPGLNLGATLQALASKNVVEVLAEPNVLAVNGKEASFLAGGEYPFPIAQPNANGGSTISIEFKEYGVRLNFIPVITPRGTIRLQVAPEVSSLDFTNAVELGGFEVPAIATRRMKTEVELSDGQSFVIGGLLDHRDTEVYQKIPFLGDIPILGKLFQSMSRNKVNTELMVFVTPEIVDPMPVGTLPPDLKYPYEFLPAISGIPMNTPDTRAAGANAPAPATVPVETLIQSMRPEPPLIIEGGYSGASTSAGANAGGTATPVPVAAPGAAAPQ